MNEVVNKFLITRGKFIPEMHLRQPGFIALVDHLLKKKERTQKIKETVDSRHVYQSELDKVCFQYDMTYRDLKDLTRRTASDNVLHDTAFDIAKNSKCDGYQQGRASMVYKFFDKRSVNASGGAIKNKTTQY